MKNFLRLFLILFFFTLVGCSTSNYLVKKDVNFSGYRYVYIQMPEYTGGGIDNYGVGSLLTKLFIQEGFTILSENQVKNLTPDKTGQTLYCTISHHSRGTIDAIATISIYNYKQELIYSGEGTFGMGMTPTGDLHGAIKNAFKNFARLYTGFDSKYALNPIEELKQQFIDWEYVDINEEELKEKFNSDLNNLDLIEGIWTSVENNLYRIGIFKENTDSKRDFVGIICETDHPLWEPRQVKIEFKKTAYKRAFSTTYYMGDHSKQGTTSYIDDYGFLEIKLKNPDGSPLICRFIKNYPENIEGELSGKYEVPKSKEESMGSGFLFSESGLIVTNYHIIQEKQEFVVIFPQIDINIRAKIVLKDMNNDIAILKLEDFIFTKLFNNPIPYSIIYSTMVSVGQEVFTLGFPLGDILGKSVKLSTGTINSLYGIQDDPRMFQINNPVQPGNSGGPLFNSKGEIIGIVVASLNAKYFYENTSYIPQNVNFAIKSDYLLNLIKMIPNEDKSLLRKNCLLDLNIEDQIKLITPFIVIIKAK